MRYDVIRQKVSRGRRGAGLETLKYVLTSIAVCLVRAPFCLLTFRASSTEEDFIRARECGSWNWSNRRRDCGRRLGCLLENSGSGWAICFSISLIVTRCLHGPVQIFSCQWHLSRMQRRNYSVIQRRIPSLPRFMPVFLWFQLSRSGLRSRPYRW